MRIQRRTISLCFSLLLAGLVCARVGQTQVLDIRSVTPAQSAPILGELRLQQTTFETFRREHLPFANSGSGGGANCDERVGRFCYWYDESPLRIPDESAEIREARERLIAVLDSNARAFPADRWTSGQLVRYLSEAGRNTEAIRAADRCTAEGWWCDALRGFARHVAGDYAASDSAWTRAVAVMDANDACDWRDLKLVLDDRLLRNYRNIPCKERELTERRVWWLSRPMMSAPGSDARTEFFSRRLYTMFVDDGPSVHTEGFDADERELLLRYGWPRAWSRETVYGQGSSRSRVMITGYEPTPAPPMLPVAATVENPAFSDSIGWRGKGLPGVRARYSPEHARRLLPLTHQAAIFRRGDSALVVMAYDVARDSALATAAAAGTMSAALVLTKGEEADATVVKLDKPGTTGTITARTSWGPMLMSAEVAATSKTTLARARYGMRATDTPGARVAVSDLLFYEPYDGMPRTLEDVLPHARSSLVMQSDKPIGVYWETYNTAAGGEGLQVAITVAPQEKDGSWMRRGLSALRLARESQPVTFGITDVSARGAAFTPRAVVVDLSTLRPGNYLMQLEITAKDTPTVRAERPLTVRAPR
jgi:hypothetical protein